MSNENHNAIWVNDLDGYVYIDSSDYEREAEVEARHAALRDIGEISLCNGKAISSELLDERGIEPHEWKWAFHEAERTLGRSSSDKELEKALVQALISLGRRYAVRRYAKWEKIPVSSAQTATLPMGLVALLHQFLSGQGFKNSEQFNPSIRQSLLEAAALEDVTAYHRTSIVQNLIHEIAGKSGVSQPRECLDREATRTMLSLARLHFSVLELKVDSFAHLSKLFTAYRKARHSEGFRQFDDSKITGKPIRNWRLRHLRPLSAFMPFSIRYGIERGIKHIEADLKLTRDIATNELALAQAGILLMRKTVYWYAGERMRNKAR
ncbi:hypothetical protein D1224_01245 [Henriciella barbarensis]|uniref:Uncharacterized protein n=1 Tax=Henriciella barbarensis TaxID=86342 RepID=A0A399R9C6_9PROT|nr:hypothetical protein [Henriciella barbarensis]RIJ26272.1 hypothetical protein D1224_01245 [Henriciella barbarensis]